MNVDDTCACAAPCGILRNGVSLQKAASSPLTFPLHPPQANQRISSTPCLNFRFSSKTALFCKACGQKRFLRTRAAAAMMKRTRPAFCDGGRVTKLTLEDGLGKTADSVFPNIATLTGLTSLYLRANGYTSIPDGVFDNLTALETLTIGGNNFAGLTIPSSLGNLSNLKSLGLYNCSFVGEIPASFEKLTNLKELYIQTNNLRGTLPSWISNFQNLGTFYFFNIPLLIGPLPEFAKPRIDCNGRSTNVCIPDGNKGKSCKIEKPCFIAPPGSDCAILQDIIPSVFDKYSDCCKVAGVTCDADNRATKLLLPNKSITGQLSDKIGGLTKLEEL
ncbi:hypothetical protein BC831DRAFT_259272 [Entophlyctis helioformis]|nr:hypothetical protein BC831DRAFT_259272 [Entophlyctis helioformis]